jgi:hypothetical protein
VNNEWERKWKEMIPPYSTAQDAECQSEGNGKNQAGMHWFSAAKCKVLPGFVFIAEILCHL